MPARLGSHSVLIAALVVFAAGGTARADWSLYKMSTGYEQSPGDRGVTYEVLRQDARGGDVRVRVRCGHRDAHNDVYRYTWTFDRDLSRVCPNQRILVHATGRREDTVGAACPPGEWTPCFSCRHDTDGCPRTLAQAGLADLRDIMTTWREFNSQFNGRIYPEDAGNGEPTSGDAEFRIFGNVLGNAVLQFQIDAGRTQIAIAYFFKALEQGDVPPDNGGPAPQPAPNGPGVRLPTPPMQNPEPCAGCQRATIQVGQRRAKPGDVVQLPVFLINANGITNMDLSILYDPNVLQAGDAAQGPMLDRVSFVSKAAVQPTACVKIAFASLEALRGSGPIAAIPFRVVGQPGASAGVGVQIGRVNDTTGGSPPVDMIFGGVQVLDPSGGLRGDADGDGQVDEMDARLALQMAVGQRPANAILDMDGDGTVDSRDALLILQAAAGGR